MSLKVSTDLTHFLKLELLKAGIAVVDQFGRDLRILCPFHSEHEPSFGILRDGRAFYCFGCGAKGNWNTLAQKLNLTPLDLRTQKMGILNLDQIPALNGHLRAILEEPLSKPAEKVLNRIETSPWMGVWRGVSEDVLLDVGARLWFDEKSQCNRILFPVTSSGEEVGFVAATLVKGIKPKYRNSEGLPSKSSFFLLDQSQKKFGKSGLALVEGPFDAIRLYSCGIPAAAILGTNSWSDKKAEHLAYRIGTGRVVVVMDGDSVGKKAARKIFSDLEKFVNVSHLTPPEGTDPGDMPLIYVEGLRRMLFPPSYKPLSSTK